MLGGRMFSYEIAKFSVSAKLFLSMYVCSVMYACRRCAMVQGVSYKMNALAAVCMQGGLYECMYAPAAVCM